MKEHLMSEIRRLTQRIGQATRGGVTELAERLRISRTQLAIRLARDFGLWLLVNAQGKTEFVDRPTWLNRVESWKKRKRTAATTPEPGPAPEASPSASSPASPPADALREFFGEPISIYTRANALSDGVLADVTSHASNLFKIPVAFTSALWEILRDLPPGENGEGALANRIQEVLRAAIAVAQSNPKPTSQFTFPILIGTPQGPKTLELLVHCGPGDRGEAVLTIGFPSDF